MDAERILVVEDEPDLALNLEYNLQKEGWRPEVAGTGGEALASALATPPALVILDLMLPDIAGTEVCRRLRANPDTESVPVLMLTAKADEIDRVVGFELGADDYVTKPFSVRELMLRVRALLRRASAAGSTEPDAPAEPGETLLFGDLRVDVDGHRVWVADEERTLTALEFRLLTTLLGRKGRVQTRDSLLSEVWGYTAEVTTRTVDTHVKRLRSKIAPLGEYIETVRGVGYRFRSGPTEEVG